MGQCLPRSRGEVAHRSIPLRYVLNYEQKGETRS